MHASMCVPGIGFRIALIHVHQWKRPCCSAWKGRLQWQTMVTFCHLLGGQKCHWLVKAQHVDAPTDKPRLSTLRALWSNQMVVLLSMVATMTSSLSEGAWIVQCAGSLCASGATHVWFATRALSRIQDCVAVVQVVDDAPEAAENNSEEEAVAPRKSDPKRAWTRARTCDCLASMGVKVPNSKTRGQARELAMQQVLPLLAQMDSDWVPPTDRVTRSAAPPNSSQPCSQVPVDDMDGLIDE